MSFLDMIILKGMHFVRQFGQLSPPDGRYASYLVLNLTHSNLVLMLILIQAVLGGTRAQYSSLLEPDNLGQLSPTPAPF